MSKWISFVGVLLFILGVYGGVRTVVNFAAFDKYPSEGVYQSIPFMGMMGGGMYGQREQDCMYPQMYYSTSGSVREPTKLEKQQADDQKKLCLDGVAEARKKAKVNDITQSLIFLALGSGVVGLRKKFAE